MKLKRQLLRLETDGIKMTILQWWKWIIRQIV